MPECIFQKRKRKKVPLNPTPPHANKQETQLMFPAVQNLFTNPAVWRSRLPRPGWHAHSAAPGRMLPWRGCPGCHRSPPPATRRLQQTEPALRPAGAPPPACSHSDNAGLGEAPGLFNPRGREDYTTWGRKVRRLGEEWGRKQLWRQRGCHYEIQSF